MNKQIKRIEVFLEMQENVLGIIRIHDVKIFWHNTETPTSDRKLPYLYEYHKIDDILDEIKQLYQVEPEKIKIINPYI